MLRVLHVAGGLEPELGGLATAILDYLVCSDDETLESHLVSPIDDPSSPLAQKLRDRLCSDKDRLTLVPRTGKFKGRASRWGISVPLASWLRRHVSDFDLVVLHGAWSFNSVAGLAAARRAGKPCVLIPHESLTEFDVNRQGSSARIIAKRNLKRLYGRYASLFLFASRAEAAQSFTERSKARQVILSLPLYDDRNRVSAIPRDFPEPGFRIGFLGRFHPKKNIDVLLRALSHLPDQFTLTVGGDGPPAFRTALESIASELGIAHRVLWKGFISADMKDQFFSAVDVLVMPSAFESFGIVAAEAMMRGVPAMVSPRTGMAELISDHGGGVVVETFEAQLAEALMALDGNRKRMGELSREAIAVATGNLSFSYIGSRLRDQYLELSRLRAQRIR